MSELDPSLPEHALAAPGVKRLARALARDEHEADDLVQDAWLRALELRPWRRGDVEPWLVRVIRNLARLARRRDARRAERERVAARPEREASSAELVARAELRRELMAHLTALREPYREALLLRHLEDLPPRAIARRLGVPISTVNARLARGLASLRERLRADERDGRNEWMGALAGLTRGPLRRAAEGGLPLALKAKLVAAAALVTALCVAIIVPLERWMGFGKAELVDARSEFEVEGAAAKEPASANDVATDALRSSVETDDRFTRMELDPERELRGLVVRPDGMPAAGVALRVLHPIARQVEPNTRDRVPDETIAELRSDADGRFRVPLEPGRVYDLEVAAAGFALERLPALYAGEDLRIVLRPALRLSGMVRFDESDAPVAGAEVRVTAGVIGVTGEASFVAVTDAEGRYEIAALPHERLNLRVAPPGHGLVTARLDPPALVPHLIHDVRVPRGSSLRGRVTDGNTQEPIAGARVAASWFEPTHTAMTDDEGFYALDGIVPGQNRTFVVGAPGYGSWDFTLQQFPAAGFQQDFFLLPGRRARGRVVDGEGEPVSGAHVLARLQPSADPAQRDELRAVSDAHGRFELADLRADLPHSLLVVAPGHATTVLDFPSDEWQLDEIELGDVALRRPARIAGRVLDPLGAPIPGICVLLTACVASSRDPEAWPAWYSEGFGAGRVLARTDARGRYAFADLPPGRYYLSAGDKGWANRGNLELELSEGDVPDNVDIELDPRLSITGTLVDAEGAPVVGEAVFAFRDDLRSVYDLTRAGGRFELHGLDAGAHTLRVWSDGETHEDQEWPVEAGAQGLRLALERVEFVEFAGVVRTPAGEPVPGCTVRRRIRGDRWGDGTTTDRDGRFNLMAVAGRAVDLMATPSAAPELTTTFTPFFDADGKWTQRYDGELLGFVPGMGDATVVLREAPPSLPR